MKLPSILLLLGLLPLSATAAFAQEDPAAEATDQAHAQDDEQEKPLEPGVAALVDGVPISQADYQQYLFERFGKRPLAQMIDRRLVKAAAVRYGIQLDEEEFQQVFSDRLAQARQGRSEEQFDVTLRDSGMSQELFEQNMRRDILQELTLDALVRATRVPSDERILRAFEARYGKDGVKVEVRHILVMPHFLRSEMIKAGTKPKDINQKMVEAEAKRLAEECHARLVAGEDFLELVPEYSNDQVSHDKGGLLPTYRPGLYGAQFTKAVAELEEGAFSKPVRSGAGQHIVMVSKRTLTVLEDVRESLVEEVMTSAPTWQDREDLLTGLRAVAEIQLW